MSQEKLHKKAQAHIAFTFPILLILIILIAIFFTIVISVKSLSAHPSLEKESSAGENLLILSGNFPTEKEPEKEGLVIDSLISTMHSDVEYKRLDALINSGQYSSQEEQQSLIKQKNDHVNALINFKDQLAELLKERYKDEINLCILLFQGPGNPVQENIKLEKNGKDTFIKISAGEVKFSYNSALFEKYGEKDLIALPQIKVLFANNIEKDYEIKYYNGECKYE